MTFNERVRSVITQKNSLLCVGLDVEVNKLPKSAIVHNRQFEFAKRIIEETSPYATAYKVNTAFYEAEGHQGWETLESIFDVLQALPGVISIADCKRGDIGNTARMYAKAFFDKLGADAITANPLMGSDSVEPFLQNPKKGVFFLCLTSNPGSADLLQLSLGQPNLSVYFRLADMVESWNGGENCVLVVGATKPEIMGHIRRIHPDLPFLIPGTGAQGGDLEKSVLNGTDQFGTNALFNSSRAILYASDGEDYAEAAARVARETRDALNAAREKKVKS